MPRIGVVLAGCGFLDGSEIHEAILTLYHLDRHGAEVTCLAPDRDQFHVVDHGTGEPAAGPRNVRTEAARIARGPVQDLATARADAFDAIVMPGGYGVAKNLSDFAVNGPECDVNGDLVRFVGEAVAAKTPIVAICIAPAILAAVLKRHGVSGATLTIGTDAGTAGAVEALGQVHQVCAVQEISVDETNRIICTPAYMLGPGPAAVGEGIGKAIDRLMAWLA
jgi:enhancing lycopene biosynthesis protein 2